MVPSWTETLIECGVEVVGRTRYCLHPNTAVKAIPIVGGTKDIRWSVVKGLKADVLLLDQEENPKRMADQSPLETFVTHIEHLDDLPREIRRMAEKFVSKPLQDLEPRWRKISTHPPLEFDGRNVSGLLSWWRAPEREILKVYYVIWKEPWMIVDRRTFIGSVLEKVGMGKLLVDTLEKYPVVPLPTMVDESSLLLFSSEPYPFAQHRDLLLEMFKRSPMALVNGESFSWFGSRSLLFLEQLLN